MAGKVSQAVDTSGKLFSGSGDEFASLAPAPKQEAPVEQSKARFNPQQDVQNTTEGTLKAVKGGTELGAEMASGFAAAVPATAWGLAAAISKGDPQEFAIQFKKLQMALTYEPRSKEGKEMSDKFSGLMSKYSEQVDKYLVEPNLEHHNELLATIGKTAGEAIPMLLPFLHKGATPTVEGGPKSGEVLPKDGKKPSGAPELTKAPIEGEATRVDEQKTLPNQKILKGPTEADKVEANVKQDVITQQQLGDSAIKTPVDNLRNLELARANKNTIVSDVPMDEITMSDPYKSGELPYKFPDDDTLQEHLEGNVYRFIPRNQRGMIDPGVFSEGIQKIFRWIGHGIGKLDETEPMKQWQRTTNPMQALEPELAATFKDFSNQGRDLIYQRAMHKKLYDNIPEETLNLMGDSVESPNLRNQLAPEARAMLERDIQWHKSVAEMAVQLRILGGDRPDYFPHIVKQIVENNLDKKKAYTSEGYFTTTTRNAKARQYEGTIGEVEAESGLERIHNFKAYIDVTYDLMEAIRGRNFVNTLRAMQNPESKIIGDPGEALPRGIPINHPAFNELQYFSKKTVSYKGTDYPIKDGTVTINGKDYMVNADTKQVYIEGQARKVQAASSVRVKPMLVSPEVYDAIKTVVLSDNPSAITNALLHIKAFSVRTSVYLPTFHLMTIATKVLPSTPGAGFGKNLWNPEAVYGKDVWDKFDPITRQSLRIPVVGQMVAGYTLRQDPAMVKEMMLDNVNPPVFKRGSDIDVYGVERPQARKAMKMIGDAIDPENMNEKDGLGNQLQAISDAYHGPLLWDQVWNMQAGVWRQQKIQGYDDLVTKFRNEKGREPSAEEHKAMWDASGKAAGYIANLIASLPAKEEFGQTYRRFLDLLLFSRGNHISNWRLFTYGVGVTPKYLLGQMRELDDVFSEKGVGLDRSAAVRAAIGGATWTLVKDAFYLALGWTAVNYIVTKLNNIPDKSGNVGGHFSWDNEPGKEKHIAYGTKPDGTVLYIQPPLRGTRDIFDDLFDPRTILRNKLNPDVNWAVGVKTNKTWNNKDILIDGQTTKEHLQDFASYSAHTLTGWDQAFDTFRSDVDTKAKYLRFLGLQVSEGQAGGPANGAATLTQVSRMQQAEKDLVMSNATQLIRRGHQQEAIDLLVKNKLVDEIPNFVARSHNPNAYLLANIDRAKLYEHATPEERKMLDSIRNQQPRTPSQPEQKSQWEMPK